MLAEQAQRELVVSEARTWLETKFHFNACVKGVGVACGPFLIACYAPYAKDANLKLPIPPTMPKDWACNTKEERFRNVVSSFCVKVLAPQTGDVALFRLGNKTRPFSHGAIVINWPTELIHAHYKSGVEYANAQTEILLKNAVVEFWSPWGFVYPTEGADKK